MQPQLTGFDLLLFTSSGLVQLVPGEDNTMEIFVEDSLAAALTQQMGIEVTSEQLTRIYEKFGELLGGMKLTITPNEGD